MPLYTPLGGSWLNMAESMQRILVRRALSGQYPQSPQEIIDWLEPGPNPICVELQAQRARLLCSLTQANCRLTHLVINMFFSVICGIFKIAIN